MMERVYLAITVRWHPGKTIAVSCCKKDAKTRFVVSTKGKIYRTSKAKHHT